MPIPLAPLQALLITQEARLERLDRLVDRAQLANRSLVALLLDCVSDLDALTFETLRGKEDRACEGAEAGEVEG